MKLILTNASVFNLAEALKRLGLANDTDGEQKTPEETTLQRGRHDRPRMNMVVTTTMFRGEIDCRVPIHGTIELGIRKETLAQFVTGWQQNKQPQKIRGEFTVNNRPADGELEIDFGIQMASFEYSEPVAISAAA